LAAACSAACLGAAIAVAGAQSIALASLLVWLARSPARYGLRGSQTPGARAQVPDFVIALLEDAVAIGEASLIVSRF